MSATGASMAIIGTFLANLVLAAAKFFVGFLSGSVALLSEGVHSAADGISQILLLLGSRSARRRPAHAAASGNKGYLAAFITSIVLLAIGSMVSVFLGVEKLLNPRALDAQWAWLAIAVLVVAGIIVWFTLRGVVRADKSARTDGESGFSFIRHAQAPEIPVAIVQNVGALVGIVLALVGAGATLISGNPVFDALAAICVGVLLMLIAVAISVVLGIAMKHLLGGEGATQGDTDAAMAAIQTSKEVEKLVSIKTVGLGGDDILVAAKIGLRSDRSVREAAADITEIKALVREAVPHAREIYVEADVIRNTPDTAPSTDVFVLKSSD